MQLIKTNQIKSRFARIGKRKGFNIDAITGVNTEGDEVVIAFMGGTAFIFEHDDEDYQQAVRFCNHFFAEMIEPGLDFA